MNLFKYIFTFTKSQTTAGNNIKLLSHFHLFISRTIEMERQNNIVRQITKKLAEELNLDVSDVSQQV